MDLFPKADELQFLIGRELTVVSFYSGSINFGWWEGGGINASNAFYHFDEMGQQHSYAGGGTLEPPSRLHALLQRRIVNIDVQSASLTLFFDDGQRLTFFAWPGVGENGLILFTDKMEDGWIVY